MIDDNGLTDPAQPADARPPRARRLRRITASGIALLCALGSITLSESVGAALPPTDAVRGWMKSGEHDAVIRAVEPVTAEIGTDDRHLLEWLGMAFEARNMQARARASWLDYLERFGDTSDAPRVRQRLNAMLTRALPSNPARNASAASVRPDTTFRGTWSNFVVMDQSTTSAFGDSATTRQSQGTTQFDARLSTTRWRVPVEAEVRASLAARYRGSLVEMAPRVRRLWVAAGDERRVVIGRQRVSGLGLYGDFDGLSGDWQLNPQWTLRAAGGLPLQYGELRSDTSRQTLSVGARFAPSRDFEIGAWMGEDHDAGMPNRRALGAELRIRRDRWALFASADHDVLHHALNLAGVRGNWTARDDLQLDASVDFRRSPFAATRNAVIGQSVEDLETLRDRGIASGVLQALATAQTVETTSATAGATWSPAPDWRLRARTAISRQSGTRGIDELRDPADELLLRGIAGYADPGMRTEGSLQVTRENLVPGASVGLLGRHVQADNRTESSAEAFGTWRASPTLSLRPRVRGLRSRSNDRDRASVLLDIRAAWQPNRGTSLHADLGYSVDRMSTPFGDVTAQRVSVFVGFTTELD